MTALLKPKYAAKKLTARFISEVIPEGRAL